VTLKIYSSKVVPTIRVKLKDSSENRELTINKRALILNASSDWIEPV